MKEKIKNIIICRNFLVLIITTIGMMPELLNYGGYFINGDATHQMLPFVYETKRMFASGVPFWSWNTYFGDNFLASYAYYTVFNPFTWINCIFPYRYLGMGFTLVLYLKFLVCGYVAQTYLKKIGFDERLSLIGSLLYTFSSWAISSLCLYMFIEPMLLFPFLLIFVERFLKEERHACTGLIMATFVTVAVNYYFAPVNLMAASIYFFFRLWHYNKLPAERFRYTLKAAGCIFMGITCASIVLIPVLLQLNGSPHESLNFDALNISKLADRYFWGLYPKAREGRFYLYLFLDSDARSNAANIAVFGLLPTFLLLFKKGYQWIKWLTVLLIVIYVTPLNGLFSLFTDCYYSRWAYALTLSIIICTLNYIRDYGLPRFKYAMLYCILIYLPFFIYAGASMYWQSENSGDLALSRICNISMDMILVGANAVSLLVVCRNGMRKDRRFTAVLSAIMVCIPLQFLIYSLPRAEFFPKEESYVTETDYFAKGEDFLSDDVFRHRTNFTMIGSNGSYASNFGLICNRPSVETYHSIQNNKNLEWNKLVGDRNHRKFSLQKFVDSFEALTSVKEHVMVANEPSDNASLANPIIKDGIFSVYESDHYIPMGFTYDKYVLADEVMAIADKNTNVDIPKILLSALAVVKEDEKELMPYLKRGTIDPTWSLDSLVAARRAITCDKFEGNTQGFDAHITLDTARVVFFSVVADDGFKAYIDGEPTKIYETNLGFSSVVVPSGSHDITFRFLPPGLTAGAIISLISIFAATLMFAKGL